MEIGSVNTEKQKGKLLEQFYRRPSLDMEEEGNLCSVIVKVEPEDDNENYKENSLCQDAENVVESLLKDAECEETSLDNADLRNIMADIEGCDDLDISEMEVTEIKMEIKDDIELIQRDEYRNNTVDDIEYDLKMEIQGDIEMIERNELNDSDLDEIEAGLGEGLRDEDENGIVELVEKDVLQLSNNKVIGGIKDSYVENMVQASDRKGKQQIRDVTNNVLSKTKGAVSFPGDVESPKAVNGKKSGAFNVPSAVNGVSPGVVSGVNGEISDRVNAESSDEASTYFCVLCEESVYGLTSAKHHLMSHLNTGNYECLDCDSIFTSNCYQAKHTLIQFQVIGKTSKGKLYRYYSAPQLLRNENLNSVQSGSNNNNNNNVKMTENMDEVDAPVYAQRVMEDGTVSLVPTQLVVRKKTFNSPIVCLECYQTFPKIVDLENHNRSVHKNGLVNICPHCNMAFAKDKQLNAHLMTCEEKGSQVHICTFCNKIFKQMYPLKYHMSTHTGKGSFGCRICGKLWKTQSVLSRHLLSHTKEKRFQCSVCDKLFASACSLKIHMNIHTGERTYPCTVCSKVYSEKRFLRIHMCIHTGEGKFICQICPKKYYSSSQLKVHMCQHTGERPHACHLCNERFLTRNSLMRHMYKHNGEKPHSCLTCGKKFVLKQDLNEHVKIHAERTHFCNICERGYTTGAYLNRHMKQHQTGKGKYMCESCDVTFISKIMLGQHNKYHHPNLLPDKDVSDVVNKLVRDVDKFLRHKKKYRATKET